MRRQVEEINIAIATYITVKICDVLVGKNCLKLAFRKLRIGEVQSEF